MVWSCQMVINGCYYYRNLLYIPKVIFKSTWKLVDQMDKKLIVYAQAKVTTRLSKLMANHSGLLHSKRQLLKEASKDIYRNAGITSNTSYISRR